MHRLNVNILVLVLYYNFERFTIGSHVKGRCVCAQLCPALCNPMYCSLLGSSVHGIFLSWQNTGASCHFLIQGIFPTQASNPHLLHLLHWQEDSLPLSHLGSPNRKLASLYLLSLCINQWLSQSKGLNFLKGYQMNTDEKVINFAWGNFKAR